MLTRLATLLAKAAPQYPTGKHIPGRQPDKAGFDGVGDSVVNRRNWIVSILICFCLSAVAHAASPQCSLSVSPNSGNAPLAVTGGGSCTDQDNDLTSITLNWGDGSAPETVNSGVISSSHTYNAPGQFTATLTGLDSLGNTGTAQQQVTVTSAPPANTAPSCQLSVTPPSGQAPLNVTANANCQDAENNIATVTITWGDGSPPAVGTQPNVAFPHTYAQAGTFTVTATARDSGGLTGSASQTVTVSGGPPPNQPPTCVFSVAPTTGQAPLNVSANGSCSDPEGQPVSTTISWGDGTSTGASSGTHTYSASGNFTVTLTGRDPSGASGSASQTVHVTGPPPNAAPVCSLSVTPQGGEAPVAVTANANCTDPENQLAGVVISFGDGFYQSGSNAVHVFPNGGTFTVTATATDSAGKASAPASQQVNITETPKLYVGVSNGQVKAFSRSGSPLATLNTNQGGSITGMALDAVGSLYVTDFTANNVTKFNGDGSLAGNFGNSYNCKPESITFDQSGNAYVGQSDCSKAILKFDAYGNLFGGFQVQTESTGSDWIDIAPDQCTIFYTSEGPSILRFNVCNNQQAPLFANGLQRALAGRILDDGGAVVANNTNIVRFDSGGRQIQTYDAAGNDCWDAVALDRDRKSFWAADFCTSKIVRFALDSGDQITSFGSGTGPNTVFGLAMKSASNQTTAAGPLIASPNSASIAAGQSATFSLAFSPSKDAKNKNFSFACANLPVGASCTVTPATFTANTDGVTATLTINTAVRTGSLFAPLREHIFYAVFFPMGAVLLGGFAGASRPTRKRKVKLFVFSTLLLASGLMLSMLGGCGGGADSSSPTASVPGATSTTPGGNYTVNISVRSGSLASSTSVTLAVH